MIISNRINITVYDAFHVNQECRDYDLLLRIATITFYKYINGCRNQIQWNRGEEEEAAAAVGPDWKL